MAKYTGKPVVLNHGIEEVYSRLSNLGNFRQRMESLPDEIRSKIGNVEFSDDSITINAAPVGEMKFTVVERVAPSRITLRAEQSPVPMHLSMLFDGEPGGENTAVKSEIDVDIPPMLKPLVGSKMQEAADKFGELVSTFFK